MTDGHGGRVRGFPAFSRVARTPRRFARSWWGKAWLKALEESSLDAEPLKRGRRYACTGHVGTITVSPGRIAAPVYGGDGTPYRTAVFVEQLADAEWERFLSEVAAKAGHIATLLDGELPYDMATAAADAGVRLLPGLGDLEPDCSCADWELPCEHAAALCYQVAWLLDDDPFVLLLMRGRGQRELLDEATRRNVSSSAARPRQPVAEAVSTPAERGAPAGRPLLAVPPAPGIDPDALELLAADAAVRAGELLAADFAAEPPPRLDLWQDTVRLAATHCASSGPLADEGPDRDASSLFVRLQQASGRSSPQFARAVQAWRYGGRAGLDVLEADWTPPDANLAWARTALAAMWEDDEPPNLRAWRNRWTLAGRGLQLRYGRDGRWYPYREEVGDWWPAGRPYQDPTAALAELLDGSPHHLTGQPPTAR